MSVNRHNDRSYRQDTTFLHQFVWIIFTVTVLTINLQYRHLSLNPKSAKKVSEIHLQRKKNEISSEEISEITITQSASKYKPGAGCSVAQQIAHPSLNEIAPKLSLPIIQTLCENCIVSLINYTETSSISKLIHAPLFLIEQGCLVRPTNTIAGAQSRSAIQLNEKDLKDETIFVHSFVERSDNSKELLQAARKQATTLVNIWQSQHIGNKNNTKQLPNLPTPENTKARFKGMQIQFPFDSWLDHSTPDLTGTLLDVEKISKTGDVIKKQPSFIIGAGGWNFKNTEEDLIGPSTPFTNIGLDSFSKDKNSDGSSILHNNNNIPNEVDANKRPTIIVSAHLFGHFYHTFADFIVPLYTTLKMLKWNEADVYLWHSVGIGDAKPKGPWRYWEKVMKGYQDILYELGLYLQWSYKKWNFGPSGFPKFENDIEMWPRRLKTSEVEENKKNNASPLIDKRLLTPIMPWKTGRWCLKKNRNGPIVFGSLQQTRPCEQICFGPDEWRPNVAGIWQQLNYRLWQKGLQFSSNYISEILNTKDVGNAFSLLLQKFFPNEDHSILLNNVNKETDLTNTAIQHGIFIRRRNVNSSIINQPNKRELENINEIEEIYKNKYAKKFRKDFNLQIHFLDLETLKDFKSQRALLSRTSLLLGVIGAGFIQQWWLPLNSRLIQIGCAFCDFPLGMHEPRKPIMFYSRSAIQLQQSILHYVQISGDYKHERNNYKYLQPKIINIEHFWESVKKFLGKRTTNHDEKSCLIKNENAPSYAPEFCLITDNKNRTDGQNPACFPPINYPTSSGMLKNNLREWMDEGSTKEEKQKVSQFWERLKSGG